MSATSSSSSLPSSSSPSYSPPSSPEYSSSELHSSGDHATELVLGFKKMKGVVSEKLWGKLNQAEKQVIKEFGRDFPIRLNGKMIDESMLSEAEKTLINETEEGDKRGKLKGALIFNRFKAELEKAPMITAAREKALVREEADAKIITAINQAVQKKQLHPSKAAQIDQALERKIESIEKIARRKTDRIEKRAAKKITFKSEVKTRIFNMMHQGLLADVNTKILSQVPKGKSSSESSLVDRGLLVGNTHGYSVDGTTYMSRPLAKRVISVDTKSQTIVACQIVYKREYDEDGQELLYSEETPCTGNRYTYNYMTNRYVLEPISDPAALQALHDDMKAVPYS
ncbi:MAG: hypothetical protein K2P51_07175 [Rhabdochlamydiaceae bacterium]|nr:hypothetical protein [Rhabdochlamydiaceae bacterium]